MARPIYITLAIVSLLAAILTGFDAPAAWLFALLVPAWMLAIADSRQVEHSLWRNFPLIRRARWSAETLRPFGRQYFIEFETDGAPISRMFRSIVYQRVYRYHDETVHALVDLLSSSGLEVPADLERSHIFRRVDQHEILRYDQISPPVTAGEFLRPPYPEPYADVNEIASSRDFAGAER